MVTIEREKYTIITEVVKREIEVWGHNLNGWTNKTTNYFIKNRIENINLIIYKTIICGANISLVQRQNVDEICQ